MTDSLCYLTQDCKATMCILLSHMSDFVTPWTVAHQAPLSKGFSRQEYWSGLPFPPLGDLPNPGIKPMSPVAPASPGRFITTEPLYTNKNSLKK